MVLQFFTHPHICHTFATVRDRSKLVTAEIELPLVIDTYGEVMKKKVIIGVIAAAVLATGAVLVIAQRAGHRGPEGFGHGGRMIGFMANKLGLTDEQKGKVKEIVEASRSNVEPLVTQMKANRKAIADLGTDGSFDQAKAEALAADQAGIMSKLIVERAKTKAQVFALLTDDQRAKAAEMRQKFGERAKGRGFGKGPGEGREF